MLANPRILHSDNVFRIASWRNAIITDVAGSIDVERMRRLGRAYRELLVDHPEGIVSCGLIRPGVPVAPADARNESARFMKELGSSILVAMIVEDKGVLAQVMQTVIRGINVLARNPRLIMFRSIEEAVSFLAPQVSAAGAGSDVAADLLAAIRFVRSDYAPEVAKPQPARDH
ncbi:MAG TPA: hypothetical protein VGP93_05400 [Polyangiaceae bacterium]|nr:hypothetical protein [Polyangiaceae bacterium]